jgi:hypothetical protein
VALLAAATTGCVEAQEEWTFGADGGGTYALRVRWNADLWHRVGSIVGGEVLRRVEGTPFPLRLAEWRDGLEGLEGVTVEEATEGEAGGGMREVSVRVGFRRVEDLLRWEVLAGRRVVVRKADDGAVRLEMDPLDRVPVVGSLATVAAFLRSPPPPEPGADVREPGPVERLGVQLDDLDLLVRMLRPEVARARFAVGVEVTGTILEVGSSPPPDDGARALFEHAFDDLVEGRDRRVRLVWRPRSLDVPPLVEHPGDAGAPPAAPDAR